MFLATFLLFAAATPRYEVADLHLTVAAEKVVMNDRGSLAGTMKMPDGTEKVFVFIDGKVHFIGNGAIQATAINSRDDVLAVGHRNIILWRNGAERSFTYSMTDSRPTVAGIDHNGNFLGTFYGTHGTDGSYDNFSYPAMRDEPRKNLRLIPVVINNVGQVAGTQSHGRGPRSQRSVLWTDGTIVELGNLSPVPGPLHITGMNDKGQIVGDTYTGDPLAMPRFHAFLWTDRHLTDLSASTPNADTYALAINNKGQVVGTAGCATLWQEGQSYDLNSLIDSPLNRPLVNAVAINDQGQILALSEIRPAHWVEYELFLLTPKR